MEFLCTGVCFLGFYLQSLEVIYLSSILFRKKVVMIATNDFPEDDTEWEDRLDVNKKDLAGKDKLIWPS